MLHAIAHIEFNAVNLALDAAWRFRDMPDAYVTDWLRIAAEEAKHFRLLQQRLQQLGHDYGDFPAHNGLWEICHRTDHDAGSHGAGAACAGSPRLDASPELKRKLANIGDHASVAILDIILQDEIGHVQVGNHWFHWLCRARGLEPMTAFCALLDEYDLTAHRGSYNMDARRCAGLPRPSCNGCSRPSHNSRAPAPTDVDECSVDAHTALAHGCPGGVMGIDWPCADGNDDEGDRQCGIIRRIRMRRKQAVLCLWRLPWPLC
jgi:uncharacterized ferritin-like protein (DUF455 family)